MRNHRHAALAALALIALATPARPSAAAAPPPAGEIAALLEQSLDRYERLGLAGVIGVRRSDEEPVIVGVGLSDRLSRREHDARTLFDIGAASTQFTAAAILRMVMAGDLALDTTLGEIFDTVPPDKAGITVDQLLTHRSGMPEVVPMGAGDANHIERALPRLLGADLIAEPGRTTRFSAAGYTLLAMIIDQVSDGHFADYVRREVFEASGMRDAHFLHDTDVDAEHVALRYPEDGGVNPIGSALTNRWSWESRGVFGVVANARDLLTWIDATRRGPFFSDEMREYFWRPDSGGRSPAGLWFESMGDTKRVLSSGVSTGFEASLAVFPEEDLAVVLLANCNGVLAKVGPEIERTILFGPEPENEEVSGDSGAARVAGRFTIDDGSRLTVTAIDEQRIEVRGRGQAALERLVHGDLYEPNWSVFYQETNRRALDAAGAMLRADLDAVRRLMGRDATQAEAEQLLSSFDAIRADVPELTEPASLGSVSLERALVSFVQIAPERVIALRWRGRDLIGVRAERPEDAIAVPMTEIRRGLYEGPGADGVSALRIAYEQTGVGPVHSIKLLATKSAGPVTAERVREE